MLSKTCDIGLISGTDAAEDPTVDSAIGFLESFVPRARSCAVSSANAFECSQSLTLPEISGE